MSLLILAGVVTILLTNRNLMLFYDEREDLIF